MKHISIGGLDVSRIGLGAMSMAGYYNIGAGSEAESIRTIHRALDLGITHIDTAEVYGPFHSEELVGQAIKGRRDQVVVATKFGVISHTGRRPGVPDSSPANIRSAVEGSLTRLGTDHIDLYYQHRVDPKTPIEDTVGALAELVTEGKIGHIGLSEAGVDTIRRANAVHPISDLQIEYSLVSRGIEAEILPVCRELGIGITAYGVLSRGLISGHWSKARMKEGFRAMSPRFQSENLEHNLSLVEKLRVVASDIGGTVAQVAIAWVAAQRTDIIPLVGARQRSRLTESLGALDRSL